MNNKNMLHAIGQIDDRFIEEAAPVAKKKPAWHRWTAAAAACLLLVAGLLVWPLLRGEPTPEANGRYKYTIQQREAAALVLRWEDRTLSERYLEMTFGEIRYSTRGQAIDASRLGAKLGKCDAWGFDHYTDRTYHQDFAVYEITGIQSEKLVAVCMEGNYYVFRMEGYNPPATFGELMTAYNLTENLPLSRFSYGDAYHLLEEDAFVWQILAECADAPVVEDDDFRVSGKHISFTATSEALGIYKRVFFVTEDGYVKTNILDYGYVYYIGQEAAGRIIEHALSKAAETEMEPYTNFIAGTITGIGDGYILVDDGVLCWNAADGMKYKVLTTDPVFSRWFKYYHLQVGDVVYIQYRGEMAAGNVISGAYSISKALIHGDELLIQE